MNINEYREKYNKNIAVLEKLYELLEESKNGTYTEYSLDTILASIDEINKEQKFYLKKIRKEICSKFNKKMTTKNYQKQEIVTEPIVQQTEVNTPIVELPTEEKTLDDIIDVLSQEKKVNLVKEEKTSIELVKEEKTSDDVTEVLTEDKKAKVPEETITSVKEESKDDQKQKERKKVINKVKAKFAAVAAAALILTGGIGAVKKLQKAKDTNANSANNTYVEITTEEQPTTETVEISEEIKDNQETEITEFKTDNNKVTDNEKETKTETVEVIDRTEVTDIEKTSEVEPVEEEKVEEIDIRVGDIVSLDNVDLYRASTDEVPRGNTSHVNGDYKAKVISVVYEGQVEELIYDNSMSSLELEEKYKEKYGEDVKISINFDVVDTERNNVSEKVGWVNCSDEDTKTKILKY